MKAYVAENGKMAEAEIPSSLQASAGEYRKKLVEKIAESDDALLERYLEGTELTNEEIMKGVREGSLTRRFIPVICGSATLNIGVSQLLDALLLCLPSPEDMSRISPVRGKIPKTAKRWKENRSRPTRLLLCLQDFADPYAG